ncbi:MAG: hypothetical protein HY254_09525 [Burkholderiales bacterium]|nr:hypothetical protein [Burkholderiales bacterium]
MNTFEFAKIELVKIGFRIEEDLIRKDFVYVSFFRVVHSFIRQEIHLTQSSLDKKELYVVLSVGVREPDFIGDSKTEFVASMRMFTEALTIEISKNGFFERGWGNILCYPIENHIELGNELEQRVLPWLDEMSNPKALVKVLQDELENGSAFAPKKTSTRSKLVTFLLFRQNKPQELQITKRPVCNKCIADILHQAGEYEQAVPYMEQWIKHHAARQYMVNKYIEEIEKINKGF